MGTLGTKGAIGSNGGLMPGAGTKGTMGTLGTKGATGSNGGLIPGATLGTAGGLMPGATKGTLGTMPGATIPGTVFNGTTGFVPFGPPLADGLLFLVAIVYSLSEICFRRLE